MDPDTLERIERRKHEREYEEERLRERSREMLDELHDIDVVIDGVIDGVNCTNDMYDMLSMYQAVNEFNEDYCGKYMLYIYYRTLIAWETKRCGDSIISIERYKCPIILSPVGPIPKIPK